MGSNFTVHNVGGAPGGEAYLILMEDSAILVDSGFSFSAEKMIGNIEQLLGSRSPDYIIITHSHYDHASGTALLRRNWPNSKICASRHSVNVFKKPSAVALIKRLNKNACPPELSQDATEALDLILRDDFIDIILCDGDTITLNNTEFTVIEAPGHTNCSIALWCSDAGLLISCETMGVWAGKGKVLPVYLTCYESSVNFICKAKRLNPENILVPHTGLLSGRDCSDFIDSALYWSVKLKERICCGFREGKSTSELIADYKAMFYNDEVKKLQPEVAFDLNASYLVPMVIRECIQDY